VHVTVVVPEGNTWPDGGSQVTIGVGSHMSTAVAVLADLGSALRGAGGDHVPGQVMTGGIESTTVILNLHSTMFPSWSSAVQMTVVSPIGKRDPDAGGRRGEAPRRRCPWASAPGT
jgi:hypothetical protein